MREITLNDLYNIACNSRERLWQKAKAVGREPKIYLHWTAGRYETTFASYHINITGNGEIHLATDDLSEVLSHTYKRNTGAIGITLCCAYNANTNSLGQYPPTEKQIEVAAQVIAKLSKALWLTINNKYVMTHAEAADNTDGLDCHEDYGPLNGCERWDLQYLGTAESPKYVRDYNDPATGGNVLRGKANWYAQQDK